MRLCNGRLALAVSAAIGGGGNASAISVVSLPNQVIFQRLGTSRNVPVGGSVTGDVGTSVEARVIDSATSSEITPWTVIGQSGNDTNFAGMLNVPVGGMYKLQARVAGSQTLVATSATVFGVGVVVGLSGQSNAVNFMTGVEKYPLGYKLSFVYDGSAKIGRRLGNTKDTLPPNSPNGTAGYPSVNNDGSRADGPVYLVNTLALELGMPVMLVDMSFAGDPIADWTNGAANNNWEQFKAKLILAGGDMELMYWYQGESNAHTATKEYMETNWNALYSLVVSQVGRTSATFKMGMVSLGTGSYLGSIEGEFGRFRVWQRDFSKNTVGWFYAGGAHHMDTTDGVHLKGGGMAYLGTVLPRSYLALKGIGVSGAGPYITGASRDGLTVTLTVAHSGGTALKDGAGGAGAAQKGYRFFDAGAAGAQIGYTSTAILSPTQIQVTLSSLPVGGLTFDYGIVNAPHGLDGSATSYIPESAVFDNVSLPNRIVGCILQPCASMSVI